jgi:hypothetical protein
VVLAQVPDADDGNAQCLVGGRAHDGTSAPDAAAWR